MRTVCDREQFQFTAWIAGLGSDLSGAVAHSAGSALAIVAVLVAWSLRHLRYGVFLGISKARLPADLCARHSTVPIPSLFPRIPWRRPCLCLEKSPGFIGCAFWGWTMRPIFRGPGLLCATNPPPGISREDCTLVRAGIVFLRQRVSSHPRAR